MFIEFEDITEFIKISTKYNTMRVYKRVLNYIEAYAQSQKNTYYFQYYGEKDELNQLEELLLKAGFTKVKEIRRWEG